MKHKKSSAKKLKVVAVEDTSKAPQQPGTPPVLRMARRFSEDLMHQIGDEPMSDLSNDDDAFEERNEAQTAAIKSENVAQKLQKQKTEKKEEPRAEFSHKGRKWPKRVGVNENEREQFEKECIVLEKELLGDGRTFVETLKKDSEDDVSTDSEAPAEISSKKPELRAPVWVDRDDLAEPVEFPNKKVSDKLKLSTDGDTVSAQDYESRLKKHFAKVTEVATCIFENTQKQSSNWEVVTVLRKFDNQIERRETFSQIAAL